MIERPEPESIPGYGRIPAAWNDLTRRVIGCAMEVHTHLGPGLVERLYEDALDYELRRAGIAFARQHPVRVRYKEIVLSEQRLDLFFPDLLVVEIKAVEHVPDIHLAQLVSYLRSADVPLGLLINFNAMRLKDGIFRRINPYSTAIRALPPLKRSPPSPSVPSDTSGFG